MLVLSANAVVGAKGILRGESPLKKGALRCSCCNRRPRGLIPAAAAAIEKVEATTTSKRNEERRACSLALLLLLHKSSFPEAFDGHNQGDRRKLNMNEGIASKTLVILALTVLAQSAVINTSGEEEPK